MQHTQIHTVTYTHRHMHTLQRTQTCAHGNTHRHIALQHTQTCAHGNTHRHMPHTCTYTYCNIHKYTLQHSTHIDTCTLCNAHAPAAFAASSAALAAAAATSNTCSLYFTTYNARSDTSIALANSFDHSTALCSCAGVNTRFWPNVSKQSAPFARLTFPFGTAQGMDTPTLTTPTSKLDDATTV